jgi:hypothetical protein
MITKETLKNEYKIIRDDEDFLVLCPFTHEGSQTVIKLFREELNLNEIPEWFDTCLSAPSCSFFNLMYFTFRGTLYYVLVRSSLLKEKLKISMGLTKPAFIFGFTIPENEWEVNQLIKTGFSQLDSEKWISSDHTFTVHGRTPPSKAVDLTILETLGLEANFFEYLSHDEKRIKSHCHAADLVIADYKGGNLNLNARPVDECCLDDCKQITGDLSLQFSTIRTLPDDLEVQGDLYVQHTPLQEFPKNLKVGGKINASKTNITELPEGFTVNGALLLKECKIKSLPANVRVEKNLTLEDSEIEYIPSDIYVGGSLNIENTPLSKKIKGQNVRELFPNVKNEIYI